MTPYFKHATIYILRFSMILLLILSANCIKASTKDGEDVNFTAIAGSKNALFKSAGEISYTINIVNPLATIQKGKITYRITTLHGKFVDEDSVKIEIADKSIKRFQLDMPSRPTGFYKISLMINVTDYDDTIRRAFGVDPAKIKSNYDKPADFDQYWNDAKAELASVKPGFKVTEMPDSAKDNRKLYLVEMQSLGNITIRGWLTIPNSPNKKRRFPVLLGLPGYQVSLKPGYGIDPDLAIFYLNVRGQGNSRDVVHTKREEFIYHDVEDRNKYVMRGVIMDCIRAVDFICAQPRLDKNKILITGGSMGGYLSVATAGLDKRVSLFSAMNPIFSDIRNLPDNDWPMYDIKKYAAKQGVSYDKVLDNLDYFDAKNFAANICTPILLGIGLLDHLAPPANEFALYNNIPKNKKIMVFDNLGHEVSKNYVFYEGRWARDAFALF